MVPLLIAAFFAALSTLACIEPCDCALQRPTLEELKAADAVFIGTFSAELMTRDVDEYGDKQHLLFMVEAGYKNVNEESVILMNRANSGCAVTFEKGETYLIYAFKTSEGELHTHGCSRTRLMEYADEDLSELPEPEYVPEEP